MYAPAGVKTNSEFPIPDSMKAWVLGGPGELKLTDKPELAVALTVKGAAPNTWLDSAPKVIVCDASTWKLWLTGVAAA